MTRAELAQQLFDTYQQEKDTMSGDYWASYLASALEMLLADGGDR